MAIKFLNKDETVQEIKNNELVIVNFFATWCGSCRMFTPVLEEISNKYTVVKVDVDQNKEYSQEMGVKGIPSTFVFKNGAVVESIVGYLPKDALEKKLSSL